MSTDPKSTKFDVTNSKYELVRSIGPLEAIFAKLSSMFPRQVPRALIARPRGTLEQWHRQLHDLGSTPCEAGHALHT